MPRLFIGFSLNVNWPNTWPEGRLLLEDNRHLTLAFLGELDEEQSEVLIGLPLPYFQSKPAGYFDKVLILPPRHPRLVTWHAQFIQEAEGVYTYHQRLNQWLAAQGFPIDSRPFLPHVTLARAPFKVSAWHHQFQPKIFIVEGLHIYESLGHSNYKPRWSVFF